MRWVGGVVLGLLMSGGAQAQTTRAYSYDALGRLSKVTPSSGNTVCYGYDAADNRTTVQTSCSGFAALAVPSQFASLETEQSAAAGASADDAGPPASDLVAAPDLLDRLTPFDLARSPQVIADAR